MLTALFLLATQAHAYKHLGMVWTADQLPRTWYLDTHFVEDSLPGVDYEDTMLQKSYLNWHAAACAKICSGGCR